MSQNIDSSELPKADCLYFTALSGTFLVDHICPQGCGGNLEYNRGAPNRTQVLPLFEHRCSGCGETFHIPGHVYPFEIDNWGNIKHG